MVDSKFPPSNNASACIEKEVDFPKDPSLVPAEEPQLEKDMDSKNGSTENGNFVAMSSLDELEGKKEDIMGLDLGASDTSKLFDNLPIDSTPPKKNPVSVEGTVDGPDGTQVNTTESNNEVEKRHAALENKVSDEAISGKTLEEKSELSENDVKTAAPSKMDSKKKCQEEDDDMLHDEGDEKNEPVGLEENGEATSNKSLQHRSSEKGASKVESETAKKANHSNLSMEAVDTAQKVATPSEFVADVRKNIEKNDFEVVEGSNALASGSKSIELKKYEVATSKELVPLQSTPKPHAVDEASTETKKNQNVDDLSEKVVNSNHLSPRGEDGTDQIRSKTNVSPEGGENIPTVEKRKPENKRRKIPWTAAEDEKIVFAVSERQRQKSGNGTKNRGFIDEDDDDFWVDLENDFPGRSAIQCLLHYVKLKELKMNWTQHEIMILKEHMSDDLDVDETDIFAVLHWKTEDEIRGKWEQLAPSNVGNSRKSKSDKTDGSSDCVEIPHPHKRSGSDEIDADNWTMDEIDRLTTIMGSYQTTYPRWDEIAYYFPGKTPIECLAQWQRISLPDHVKGKGSWSAEEDAILLAKREIYGRKWSKIAEFLPGRAGKQCRERYVNHVDPNLKKGEWTDDEEAVLIGMHEHHGNKWTKISKHLPGRSDNDVKNHWYSTIARKFDTHGRKKLTTAAIEQVFMLVNAGIVSRDIVKGWPNAPPLNPIKASQPVLDPSAGKGISGPLSNPGPRNNNSLPQSDYVVDKNGVSRPHFDGHGYPGLNPGMPPPTYLGSQQRIPPHMQFPAVPPEFQYTPPAPFGYNSLPPGAYGHPPHPMFTYPPQDQFQSQAIPLNSEHLNAQRSNSGKNKLDSTGDAPQSKKKPKRGSK